MYIYIFVFRRNIESSELTGHMHRPVTLSHTPLAPVVSGGFSQVEGQAIAKYKLNTS